MVYYIPNTWYIKYPNTEYPNKCRYIKYPNKCS